MTYPPTDPNSAARANTLNEHVGGNLNVPTGVQAALGMATERHTQTASTLNDLLGQVEGVPTEHVATQILTLQTRLQAPLQTTSLLLSLANYL